MSRTAQTETQFNLYKKRKTNMMPTIDQTFAVIKAEDKFDGMAVLTVSESKTILIAAVNALKPIAGLLSKRNVTNLFLVFAMVYQIGKIHGAAELVELSVSKDEN
jgi:hypothetical protein